MPLSHLSTPVALLVGALLIALALVARPPAGRYQLVPLAPGDYVVEVVSGGGSAKEMRTIVAFRVVP